ncbi:MAG: hypothetical protein Rubg2KO_25460 [Rubricoccaceae bacterium]
MDHISSNVLSFPHIALRQLGQYDAAFEARVDPAGYWHIEGGSYVTRGRQEGQLSPPHHRELARLASRVDMDAPHPMPTTNGFISELTIGDHTTRWWGPPPTEALRALANALARLPS